MSFLATISTQMPDPNPRLDRMSEITEIMRDEQIEPPEPPSDRTQRARLPMRTAAAMWTGKLAAQVSRATGSGSGGVIGGRVTLALDPHALRALTRGRTVILITGTNGKTTTTLMLSRAMGVCGPVVSNHSGANMPDGLVAALTSDPTAPYAVLECDESYVPKVAEVVQPEVLVLLNLSRDQMDRVGEVRATERALRAAITKLPNTTVVANCDDVLVTSAARSAAHPVWVAAGGSWRGDAASCPSCGEPISETPGGWHCRCGLARPRPDWVLDNGQLVTPTTDRLQLDLRLPGTANQSNASMAAAAAASLGAPVGEVLAQIRGIRDVGGRYQTVRRNGRIARLLLAKNPAGWAETLLLLNHSQHPVVIAVNGREADGRDLSWLWDVPFEQLHGRPVVVTGERSADLSVRLTYAGVSHSYVEDQVRALDALDPGEIEVVANYTAFRDLVGRLSDEP